jgi:hypothetical protein
LIEAGVLPESSAPVLLPPSQGQVAAVLLPPSQELAAAVLARVLAGQRRAAARQQPSAWSEFPLVLLILDAQGPSTPGQSYHHRYRFKDEAVRASWTISAR